MSTPNPPYYYKDGRDTYHIPLRAGIKLILNPQKKNNVTNAKLNNL